MDKLLTYILLGWCFDYLLCSALSEPVPSLPRWQCMQGRCARSLPTWVLRNGKYVLLYNSVKCPSSCVPHWLSGGLAATLLLWTISVLFITSLSFHQATLKNNSNFKIYIPGFGCCISLSLLAGKKLDLLWVNTWPFCLRRFAHVAAFAKCGLVAWFLDHTTHSLSMLLICVGECLPCPRGSFSSTSGSSTCTCCPVGLESTHARDGCVPCQPSEFSLGANDTSNPTTTDGVQCGLCMTCSNSSQCKVCAVMLELHGQRRTSRRKF